MLGGRCRTGFERDFLSFFFLFCLLGFMLIFCFVLFFWFCFVPEGCALETTWGDWTEGMGKFSPTCKKHYFMKEHRIEGCLSFSIKL